MSKRPVRATGNAEYLRSDNGSEFTARKVQEWLQRVEVKTLFIKPGSLWENGYVSGTMTGGGSTLCTGPLPPGGVPSVAEACLEFKPQTSVTKRRAVVPASAKKGITKGITEPRKRKKEPRLQMTQPLDIKSLRSNRDDRI